MKVEQKQWNRTHGWSQTGYQLKEKAAVVLAFGNCQVLGDPQRYHELKQFYPDAHILTCTTAGEIIGAKLLDNSIVVSAIHFDKTTVKAAAVDIAYPGESYQKGYELAQKLKSDGLAHLFVISDGHIVNGSDLVNGLNHGLHKQIPITGGLAGDGILFKRTLVGIDTPPTEGKIAAIGFYGKNLKVGYGSKGGWDAFGPERIVTRSEGNVLYDLDNKSALQLYKQYLGPLSGQLPSSAQFMPIALRLQGSDHIAVRTILAVNEEDQSMVFTGDLPRNSRVRLMKANLDRLIEEAVSAADNSLAVMGSFQADFAVLISCVGRRLALTHRTEEEIEEVTHMLGKNTAVSGFYSYGEISPVVNSTACELHNQTMTVTVYRED
ncbi:FIST N-terminal domain-containing protein [Chryseolinea sp. H1M3-3]|uniref:FIST signal transduction protein n=1 Tax=Chryseolinea sp. H1M3-3 TaxID=3034144 RepID=UPI0023EAB2D2|nr:FIST N-terminal domain-containing protein [Chryseolinea sp. H1M3-3]